MKDRVYRGDPNADGVVPKENEIAQGAIFLTNNDAGIRELMTPALPALLQPGKMQEIELKSGEIVKFQLNREFWKDYFEGTASGNLAEFIGKHFHGKKIGANEFEDAMEAFITQNLANTFIVGPNSSETKVNEFLKLKQIDGKIVFNYSQSEIYTKFHEILTNSGVIEKLQQGNKFLFGNQITSADASLFAVLVQFFNRPDVLNMAKFREFLTPIKINQHDFSKREYNGTAKTLHKYMLNVLEFLGLDGKQWSALSARPWQLNFGEVEYGQKYDGPFLIETDDLIGLEKLAAKTKDFTTLQTEQLRNALIKNKLLSETSKINQIMPFILNKFLSAWRNNELLPNQHGNNILDASNKKKKGKFMELALLEIGAYICGLGDGKGEENGKSGNCNKNFENKIIKVKNDLKKTFVKNEQAIFVALLKFQEKIPAIVYNAIVIYNEDLVDQNVLNAIMQTSAELAMAVKSGNLGILPKLANAPKDGNEL